MRQEQRCGWGWRELSFGAADSDGHELESQSTAEGACRLAGSTFLTGLFLQAGVLGSGHKLTPLFGVPEALHPLARCCPSGDRTPEEWLKWNSVLMPPQRPPASPPLRILQFQQGWTQLLHRPFEI